MRWTSEKHRSQNTVDVKMTPMIDVVFLLLIFFVCTASFQVVEESLPTPLPRGTTASADDPPADPELAELEEVVVLVRGTADAVAWQVGGTPCAGRAELRQTLKALAEIDPELPVILDVEPEVALGAVIDVYDLCRMVGFRQIQFAAPRREG